MAFGFGLTFVASGVAAGGDVSAFGAEAVSTGADAELASPLGSEMLVDGFMVSGNVGVSTTGCVPLKVLPVFNSFGLTSVKDLPGSINVDGLTRPDAVGAGAAISEVGATGIGFGFLSGGGVSSFLGLLAEVILACSFANSAFRMLASSSNALVFFSNRA